MVRGVSTGLLAYPILMAADILVYNATHVPVGEDQLQHLELTREIARSFNSQFAPKKRSKNDKAKGSFASTSSSSFTFGMPEAIMNKDAARVMSLRVPTSKMSKSDPSEASRIHLSDSDDQIAFKIRRATTDSDPSITYDPQGRPGVSNLIDMATAVINLQAKTQYRQKVSSI